MTSSLSALLSVHLAATAAMAGLIWFVQLVHYPLFASIGEPQFQDYEAEHTKRTAWVVGPFMAAEGVAALWIAAAPGPDLGRLLPLIGLSLLAIVHSSTVLLQVPRHRALTKGFDPAVARTLVSTNWIRTLAWSARVVTAVAMLVTAS